MNIGKLKFEVWIRCYCYNNAYLLFLKRNLRKLSNFLIVISSPYILVSWAISSLYEVLIGKNCVSHIMKNDDDKDFKHEIAMVSISKNEGPYIKEWIEFHKLVGFTKFYFYPKIRKQSQWQSQLQ